MDPAPGNTTPEVRGNAVFVRRFEIAIVAGPDAGAHVVSAGDEVTIGTAPGVTLRVSDASVSRHHCVLRATRRGIELADLGSRNGTFVGEHELVRGYLASGARVRIGTTTFAVAIRDDEHEQPLALTTGLGRILGASPAMRRVYPMIEQHAPRDANVLIRGEVGTGKGLIAEATLRAAFADATDATIFLDEVGDLPLDLQGVVLRAIEAEHPTVRVIAASARDLRVEVNARRFRTELLYRLDVLRIDVPPLRDREGDVALLAARFWRDVRNDEIPPYFVAELVAQSWPGNLAELRNTVERAALAGWTAPAEAAGPSYGDAKERAVRQWERAWVEGLLAEHDHNLSRAARAAHMGRSHLRQLCQRYGLRPRPGGDD